jgi:uncharacterized Zn-binding protein involved in type VI secretion
MTSPVVRIGDINNAGGAIIGPSAPTVITNGLPTSVIGDRVSAHAPCPKVPSHCAAFVGQGSATVLAEGRPVVYVGAIDSCGHARATGSPTVITGF